MDRPNPNHRIASVSTEASEWFVRLKDDDLSDSEKAAYFQWLRLSPTHIAEMLRISRVYGALHGIGLSDLTPKEEASIVVDWNAANPGATAFRPPARTSIRWRRYSIAAGVLLVSLALAWQQQLFSRKIETGPSEWRQVSLDDHSVVRLGPRTQLRIEFSDRHRHVDLERGEATFQVAKESGRPFAVHAGAVSIRALGTEFGVRRLEGTVVVTVAEGKVAVDRAGTSEIQAVPLAAGEEVAVEKRGKPVIRRVDVERELAWAKGKIFVSETVAEAVREFNRRNRMQITVADRRLAAMPVRAMFDAGDPESFAAFLAAASGARVSRPSRDELLLEREENLSQ